MKILKEGGHLYQKDVETLILFVYKITVFLVYRAV